jgi:molybdopterin biosynthesis enzyme
MMMKRIIAAGIFISLAGTMPANALSCEANFHVDGTPLLTAMSFRSSEVFPRVDSKKALGNLRAAMLAEGFISVSVDRSAGALTAFQETTGSGRPQTIRVSARKSGNGTRVDAVFMIQAGQIADASLIRGYLCRVVAAARD